jgi:O-antigen/teichoic acid export membrane protein
VLLTGAQQALISVPYTIYTNRLTGRERRLYAGSALAHLMLLVPVAMVVIALAAAVSATWFAPLALAGVLWLVAAMVPFLLLREFLRRVAFAHLRMDMALAIDAIASVVQIAAIGLLATRGWLTPATAYLAMGASCAVAGGSFLLARRGDFEVRWSAARQTMRRDWQLGRWVFLQQLATVLHMYVCTWALALLAGVSAAGVFTACVSIVMICNPFMQAMGNHFAPRFARAMAAGGRATVRKLFWHASAIVGSVVLAFALLLIAFGGQVVELLYRGPAFAGLSVVVAVLALRMLMFSVRLGSHQALLVLERAELSVLATFVGLTITTALSLWMIGPFGVMGAAIAWVIGTTVETILQTGCFFYVSRRANAAASNEAAR